MRNSKRRVYKYGVIWKCLWNDLCGLTAQVFQTRENDRLSGYSETRSEQPRNSRCSDYAGAGGTHVNDAAKFTARERIKKRKSEKERSCTLVCAHIARFARPRRRAGEKYT